MLNAETVIAITKQIQQPAIALIAIAQTQNNYENKI